MPPDQPAIERARTEGDIHFPGKYWLEQLGRFRDRRREIGVRKQCDRVRRREQSSPNGPAFPMIMRRLDEAGGNAVRLRKNLSHDIRRRVHGTVVHHDQLALRARLAQIAKDFGQALTDAMRLVKGGHDEGEGGKRYGHEARTLTRCRLCPSLSVQRGALREAHAFFDDGDMRRDARVQGELRGRLRGEGAEGVATMKVDRFGHGGKALRFELPSHETGAGAAAVDRRAGIDRDERAHFAQELFAPKRRAPHHFVNVEAGRIVVFVQREREGEALPFDQA